jgi:3-carboxy-cis,cis-muconate cycloisomerase
MDVMTRRQLIQYSTIMSGILAGKGFVPPTPPTPQDSSLPGQSAKPEAGSQIASTPIDSFVLSGIFSTDVMRRVFSDQNRLQKYLDVEAALARVQGRLGIIPGEAADEIQRQASADKFDLGKLKARTELVGYPVQPVVEQLVSLCSGKLGEYCHWGATTQDITDTATVLQIREALQLVDEDLTAICQTLADLAKRYRDTPMAGRTHLQHAVPITFGLKMAVLLAAFERHRERLAEIRPRVLVGQFAGAAGNLSSLGMRGLEVQSALMIELRLGQPEIVWHTIRDRFAEVGCFLGLVTGTLGKLATDVKLLMQTEVSEVFEPFEYGRGSSSTMPQKRNPISCEYIQACTSAVRQNVASLLDAMIEDHERASGPWQIEWIALPEAFLLSAGALSQTRKLVSGLQVDPKRMRTNLDMTGGLIVSEAVMMGLAPYLGREHAHDLVYKVCREVSETGRPMIDLLVEEPEVSRSLDRAALTKLVDPANYLGLSGAMVDRVLNKPETVSR